MEDKVRSEVVLVRWELLGEVHLTYFKVRSGKCDRDRELHISQPINSLLRHPTAPRIWLN